MSNIVVTNNNEIDQHIWSALKNSLYTGAKDESIKMVLDYCKAAKLDPMQKPVHIVPMNVKNSLTGRYEYKDVVMPGVGLYRIQAARSNQYAGVSEPEFGEDVTCNLGGVDITYPKWCKVTVKKLVNNTIVEFTAKEYWLENYATKKDTPTPNSMWQKRPYGQIAKCAEAQALRKAFPEIVSQHPTAEEMEGKDINDLEIEIKNITPKSQSIVSKLDTVLENIEAEKSETLAELIELIKVYNVPSEIINKWCSKAGVESIADLGEEKQLACIEYINKQYNYSQGIEAA
ncbi:MAG TPA: phage recombination protein Bet [Bacteroidales bacterium]|nr:phage recombination protein Bet [Bacteroidales bacterium]